MTLSTSWFATVIVIVLWIAREGVGLKPSTKRKFLLVGSGYWHIPGFGILWGVWVLPFVFVCDGALVYESTPLSPTMWEATRNTIRLEINLPLDLRTVIDKSTSEGPF